MLWCCVALRLGCCESSRVSSSLRNNLWWRHHEIIFISVLIIRRNPENEFQFQFWDEIQKTIKELFCSKKFTGEVHNVLSLLSVLNIFLSITAFLSNTLILVAMHEETSLHAPSTSKLLYRNLAISDLCVGVILEPTAITYLLSVINEKWEICYYASVINHVAANLLCEHSYCNKRGQTSRLVAKAQIQTSYNFEKNLFKCDSYLDYVCFWHIILLLESFFHL